MTGIASLFLTHRAGSRECSPGAPFTRVGYAQDSTGSACLRSWFGPANVADFKPQIGGTLERAPSDRPRVLVAANAEPRPPSPPSLRRRSRSRASGGEEDGCDVPWPNRPESVADARCGARRSGSGHGRGGGDDGLRAAEPRLRRQPIHIRPDGPGALVARRKPERGRSEGKGEADQGAEAATRKPQAAPPGHRLHRRRAARSGAGPARGWRAAHLTCRSMPTTGRRAGATSCRDPARAPERRSAWSISPTVINAGRPLVTGDAIGGRVSVSVASAIARASGRVVPTNHGARSPAGYE